jgi:hypothetical protein
VNKTNYKANPPTAATTPLTVADAFEASRRDYEAAAGHSAVQLMNHGARTLQF